MERVVGTIEAAAARRGIPAPVQGTFGSPTATALWAVRYATEGPARTLFTSCDADAIRRLHPENPRLQRLHHDDRLVVSEPLSDLPGLWREVPPATAVSVRRGEELEERPFVPTQTAVPVGTGSAPDAAYG